MNRRARRHRSSLRTDLLSLVLGVGGALVLLAAIDLSVRASNARPIGSAPSVTSIGPLSPLPGASMSPVSPEPTAPVEPGAEPEPATPSWSDPHIDDLRRRHLELPVMGISAERLSDSFDAPRDHARRHEAIDILAPRGTPVLAVEAGTIEKLFTSALGGLTVYEFDPTRTYEYYYAHLDGYALHLRERDRVERGQVLGYVGTTGNAPKNTPHLHFGVSVLTPEKHWWQSNAIDPYLIWRNRK
jgi:murein DD-endopeptidase MepM/ murein hydrolase activator NlpD